MRSALSKTKRERGVSPTPPLWAGPARKVLLVDDAPEARLILRRILQVEGHRVIEAGSGSEALKILSQDHDIGLVLLDLVIPDMDGFGVLAQLAAMPTKPRVCVISALGDKETIAKALAFEADDFLVKPIFPKDVAYKVRSLLGTPEPEDESLGTTCDLDACLGDDDVFIARAKITWISENGMELEAEPDAARPALLKAPEHLRLVCPALWHLLAEFDDGLGGFPVRIAAMSDASGRSRLRADFVGLSAPVRQALRDAIRDHALASAPTLFN